MAPSGVRGGAPRSENRNFGLKAKDFARSWSHTLTLKFCRNNLKTWSGLAILLDFALHALAFGPLRLATPQPASHSTPLGPAAGAGFSDVRASAFRPWRLGPAAAARLPFAVARARAAAERAPRSKNRNFDLKAKDYARSWRHPHSQIRLK